MDTRPPIAMTPGLRLVTPNLQWKLPGHKFEAAAVVSAAVILMFILQLVAARPAAAVVGAKLWTATWNTQTPSAISHARVAVAPDGSIYEAAQFVGGAHTRLVVTSVAADGTVAWVRRYQPAGRDVTVAAIAVGSSGGLTIVGTMSAPGGSDWLVVKYLPSGTRAWVRTFDFPGAGPDAATGVVAVGPGRSYVTGVGVFAGKNRNAVTKAFNGAGVTLWTRAYNGPFHGADTANAIAGDVSGNLYVAGDSQTAAGETDLLLIRYSPAGHREWAQKLGVASAITTANAVAVVGDTVSVAGAQTAVSSPSNALVADYSSAGSLRWSKTIGGTTTDSFLATGVRGNGSVAAAGFENQGSASGAKLSAYTYDAAGAFKLGIAVSNTGFDSEALAVSVPATGAYVVTGFAGSATGGRVEAVFVNPDTNAASFKQETSTGVADRGESVATSADAAYVGGELNGDLVLIKYSLQ
jgi:hypothetical protein